MEKGFRLAGTLKEFINDLAALKSRDHKFIVWQNDKSGKKQIVKAKYHLHEQNNDVVSIHTKLENSLTFSNKEPIYIFEEIQGMLFKGYFDFCVNNVLKINAENKVFLKEKRQTKRFYFHYTPVNAEIIFEDKRVEVNLHDINHKGYAFYIPPKSASKYKAGDGLVLTKIHGIDLPKPLAGVVIHCSERKLTKKREGHASILVGIQLAEESKLLAEVAKSI